jgi:dCMP deaminase
MSWAERAAQLSHARRLQVGAVIVKDDSVISYGYNGMPAGWDNNCEDKVYDPGDGGWLDPEEFVEKYPYTEMHGEFNDQKVRYRLKTKPEVLHAEMNSLMKLAKSSSSGNQASIFVTHSPCLDCAKGIFQAGIKEVFYREDYRSNDGKDFLKKSGVSVIKC